MAMLGFFIGWCMPRTFKPHIRIILRINMDYIICVGSNAPMCILVGEFSIVGKFSTNCFSKMAIYIGLAK
jgi:hypothetical protein